MKVGICRTLFHCTYPHCSCDNEAPTHAQLLALADPTPTAPLTLHVPVWPISEDTPKDREIMLYDGNYWSSDCWHVIGSWEGWWPEDSQTPQPTHWTELKYMALPDSTGGEEMSQCCCVHSDARDCYLWRYGIAMGGGDGEECQCSCHDEEDSTGGDEQ